MERYFIVTVLSLIVGCGTSEQSPTPNLADYRPDMALDMPRSDVAEDVDLSDPPDTDLADGAVGECDDLEQSFCFERPDCAWDGTACHMLISSGAEPLAFSSVLEGIISLKDQEELENTGDRAARIMMIRTGDSIHGSIAISQVSDDRVLPFRGEVDVAGGRMKLQVLVPRCLEAPDESCDEVVPALMFSGNFVEGQWLFPAPTPVDGLLNMPVFIQNLRFQPNDGVKPSQVGENAVAFIFSIFHGEPLAASAVCSVDFTHSSDVSGREFSALVCGQQELKIVADSFVLKNDNVWFQFENHEDPITFIGWNDNGEMGGVLVRDQNKYFQESQPPISPNDVDVEDIVGSLIVYPGGPGTQEL